MPIFSYNQTPSAEIVDEAGNRVALHPRNFLQAVGARIPVRIGRNAGTNKKLGEEIPEIEGIALFDTGATNTAIDLKTAAALKLPVVTRNAYIATPSVSRHKTQAFGSGYFSVTDSDNHSLEFPLDRALGVNLERQGIQILIGRDILEKAILIYNGYSGSFSFSV